MKPSFEKEEVAWVEGEDGLTPYVRADIAYSILPVMKKILNEDTIKKFNDKELDDIIKFSEVMIQCGYK